MSPSKQLLVVFGATGNQGGSIAQHVLADPELSNRYSVRAISRDITNPKAKALESQGAELIQADLEDPSSLKVALKNADFVFTLTNTQYDGSTREIETKQGKLLCEEALQAGVKYIIFSTLPSASMISKGKLTHADHFDVKAELEQYIRTLPIKSAFFAPGSFMQNLLSPFMAPRPSPENDGTYTLTNFCQATDTFPLIDITDTGKWVAAILADPDTYEGKRLVGAYKQYTFKEMCEILSKVSGKTVKHQYVPDEVFKSFFPPPIGAMLFDMWTLIRDYGYYGEGEKEQIEWSNQQARGTLTDLETFLRKSNFQLE